MATELQVQVNARDVERALWLTVQRHTPGLRVLPATIVVAMLIPVGIALLALQGNPLPISAYLFAVGGAAFALGVPLFLRMIARRAMTIRDGQLRVAFSEDGYEVEAIQGEDGRTRQAQGRWADVYEVVRTRQLVVLYEKPSVFHVVPLADGAPERERIDALVDAHVARKRRAIDVFAWLSPGFITLVILIAAAVLFGARIL